jgi:hypothetical protein
MIYCSLPNTIFPIRACSFFFETLKAVVKFFKRLSSSHEVYRVGMSVLQSSDRMTLSRLLVVYHSPLLLRVCHTDCRIIRACTLRLSLRRSALQADGILAANDPRDNELSITATCSLSFMILEPPFKDCKLLLSDERVSSDLVKLPNT